MVPIIKFYIRKKIYIIRRYFFKLIVKSLRIQMLYKVTKKYECKIR